MIVNKWPVNWTKLSIQWNQCLSAGHVNHAHSAYFHNSIVFWRVFGRFFVSSPMCMCSCMCVRVVVKGTNLMQVQTVLTWSDTNYKNKQKTWNWRAKSKGARNSRTEENNMNHLLNALLFTLRKNYKNKYFAQSIMNTNDSKKHITISLSKYKQKNIIVRK